jgi:hypothetical protein
MRMLTLMAALGAAAFAGEASAQYFQDGFDRSDTTNMGSKWTEVIGDFSIFGNRAYVPANSGGEGLMLATTNLPSRPVITLDIAYGGSISYASVFLHYASASDNTQVRFADTNGDLAFDRVFLLYGDTGQGWPGMTGGPADFAITPTTTSNLRIDLRNNALRISLAPVGYGPGNFPDGATETFTRSLPPLGFPDRFGLGGTPAISFDNVVVRAPEPASALLALGATPLLRRRRRAG